MRPSYRLGSAVTLVGAAALLLAAAHRNPDGLYWGTAPVQSVGAITFGPDNTLFIADTRAGQLLALDVADNGTAIFTDRYMMRDVDAKVAAALGTMRDKVRFHDMAVHPRSKAIYFSVSRLEGEERQPALVRVRGPESAELVDFGRIRFANTPLPEAPSRDAKTPWGQPQWTLAVTDLAFSDGELYVAGLSNEQFASALRRIPFPFGKEAKLNTVEIYHTSHDKWETASPIEAFLPLTVDGNRLLLAGYGCSPIATFNRAELASAKHLKGRTVAELGGGSRPIDMIRYEKDGKQFVLIANNNRTLMRLDASELAKAPALTSPVTQAYQPAGVGYLPIASTGVMQVDDFNADMFALLQRDTESGAVNLIALQKKWL